MRRKDRRAAQAGPREQLDVGQRLPLQRARPRSPSRRDPFRSRPERRGLERDEVCRTFSGSSRTRPSSGCRRATWRASSRFDGEIRDEGIVPLEHFVDEAGPDAVAVAVEMDGNATIHPAVYVRSSGRLVERRCRASDAVVRQPRASPRARGPARRSSASST